MNPNLLKFPQRRWVSILRQLCGGSASLMPLASSGLVGSREPQQHLAECANRDWKDAIIAIAEHFFDVSNQLGFVPQIIGGPKRNAGWNVSMFDFLGHTPGWTS